MLNRRNSPSALLSVEEAADLLASTRSRFTVRSRRGSRSWFGSVWRCPGSILSAGRLHRQGRYDHDLKRGGAVQGIARRILLDKMVRKAGLEPASLAALAPKASVFAISPLPHGGAGEQPGKTALLCQVYGIFRKAAPSWPGGSSKGKWLALEWKADPMLFFLRFTRAASELRRCSED